MALAERIPELIQEGRREAGITQQLLAERVGVDQSTISRWERGRERPSLEQADLVFESLGLVIQVDRRRSASPPDEGVDRAQIQAKLRLSPEQRLDAIKSFTRFAAEVQRGR